MKLFYILMLFGIVCETVFSQNTDSSVDETISGTWTFNNRLIAKGGITANAYLEVDSYGFNGRFANNYIWFTSNSYNPFAYVEQRGVGPINFRFKGVDKHVISENGIKIGSSGSTDIPVEALDVNGIGLSNKGFKASLNGTHSSNIWTNQGGSGVDVFDGTNQVVRFGTYGVNFVSGSLSIGKNTTPSAKLDVAGNIKAHEIEVTLAAMQDLQLNGTLAANNITYTANGNTADFVFEDNYQLKDLSEVEAFIKANKHLPEVPSAAEMEEEGINLAEMNKLLLMKVEELTLYSIEQEKARKELESEVKRQKAEVEEVRSSESEVRKEMENQKERLAKMESLLEKLTLNP